MREKGGLQAVSCEGNTTGGVDTYFRRNRVALGFTDVTCSVVILIQGARGSKERQKGSRVQEKQGTTGTDGTRP